MIAILQAGALCHRADMITSKGGSHPSSSWSWSSRRSLWDGHAWSWSWEPGWPFSLYFVLDSLKSIALTMAEGAE